MGLKLMSILYDPADARESEVRKERTRVADEIDTPAGGTASTDGGEIA